MIRTTQMWRNGPIVRWLRWSVLASALLPLAAYAALQAGADLFGQVRVRGYSVPRGEAGVAALRAYSARWPQEPLVIRAGPYAARYTRAQLGASMPTERLCAKVLNLGRTGMPGLDLSALWASHNGGIDLALSPRIDQPTLVARLAELRRKLERPPVPGTILNNGSVLQGIPGFTIDFAEAIAATTRALREDRKQVRLAARSVAPPKPIPYGSTASGRFTFEMVHFETKYRTAGASAGRANNIEVAVSHLDGVVMPPGGELSFNAVVGERTYSRGFATAKEINQRRVVDGVGGGVCQVAATLHAAAFLGGFDLTEYRPHSRPSHYIELGLDTMVSWPDNDMRIANPYPFAVRVRAQARDGLLRVALEGSGKPHLVEWHTEILSRKKPGVQRVLDDTLAPGQTEVLQDAIDGLTVRRVRTLYLPDGPRREESILRYPPNDRIVAVGPGSAHPPLKTAASVRAQLQLEDF